MKKIYVLLSVITLFTCANFEKGPEQLFLYEVQSKEHVSSGSMTKTLNIIKKRLNNLGVNDVEVGLNNKNEIEVKTRTKLDENRLNAVILNPGKLEFWDTYKGEQFLKYVVDIDLKLSGKDSVNNNFIQDKFTSIAYSGSPILGYFKISDTLNLVKTLNANKQMLEVDLRHVKFLYGNPERDSDLIAVYTIKSNIENKAPILAKHITDAKQHLDTRGRPSLSIEMDEQAAAIWERMTGKAFRNKSNIAITINNNVFSAPSVSSGAIKVGRSEITGNFSIEEAQNFAAILSAGGRIPKLKFLGSTILEESKD